MALPSHVLIANDVIIVESDYFRGSLQIPGSLALSCSGPNYFTGDPRVSLMTYLRYYGGWRLGEVYA